MEKMQLIDEIVDYFETNIFERHLDSTIKKHSKLESYNINPIVVRYLSKILENNYNPEGVAKALFYPRVLGTSINTSFGTRIQSMFIDLKIASGSLIKGMDIEFIDKIDNRKKWCQLKAGPNTINYEDVAPLMKKFSDTINLARTNNAFKEIRNTDFIVGVLYGNFDELSMHYRKINEYHPVYVGEDFWHRITGHPNFYSNLVLSLHESIENLNIDNRFELGLQKLTIEIKKSQLFGF